MESSKRRLFVVAGHFDASSAASAASSAIRPLGQLQDLLDHDNIELRLRMKDYMKHDIYIPWVARTHDVAAVPERCRPSSAAGATTSTCAMTASWPGSG
jgi:hypothetical protein